MPRTIPLEEIKRIQELAKVRPKLSGYQATMIMREETGNQLLSQNTVRKYLSRNKKISTIK